MREERAVNFDKWRTRTRDDLMARVNRVEQRRKSCCAQRPLPLRPSGLLSFQPMCRHEPAEAAASAAVVAASVAAPALAELAVSAAEPWAIDGVEAADGLEQ